LYSDQLVTQYFCFGILSRWAALNLCGNYRILNETETFRIRRKLIHATTPAVRLNFSIALSLRLNGK
jgi:hypothetical protein